MGSAAGARVGAPRPFLRAPGLVIALVVVVLLTVGLASGPSEVRSSAAPRRLVLPRTYAVEVQPPTPRPHHSVPASLRLRVAGRPRVLLVGDSLMFGAYPALQEVLGSNDVETRFVGMAGTGLLSGQGWWLRGISSDVWTFDPDVVVIEACCNYANHESLYRLGRQPVRPDTRAMFEAWAANARAAVALATARGARVFWVVTPDAGILVTENVQVRIHLFDAVYERLGVPLIDWRRAVEPDGVFTTSMATPFGDVPVRRSDTLHLTGAGDYVVARATWEAIARSLPRPVRAVSAPMDEG